jgi:hypothetical protein
MCARPVRWRLRRLLPMTIWLKIFFCGPDLAFSAGPLEGLGIVISYWIWGLGYGLEAWMHQRRAGWPGQSQAGVVFHPSFQGTI